MTEQEWLVCNDPAPMLRLLREKASDRKARLFACACCRRIWHWLKDDRGKQVVEVMESCLDRWPFAKIQAASHGLSADTKECVFRERLAAGDDAFHPAIYAMEAVHAIVYFSTGWTAAIGVALNCCRALAPIDCNEAASEAAIQDEKIVQASILREVMGNAFHPITIDPAWFTPTVKTLAQTIYDERRFAEMPILADALDEAGCTDADILNHCRQPGEHVRSCWVVDLLLGKT